MAQLGKGETVGNGLGGGGKGIRVQLPGGGKMGACSSMRHRMEMDGGRNLSITPGGGFVWASCAPGAVGEKMQEDFFNLWFHDVPILSHIGSSVEEECLPTVAMEGPHGLLHWGEPWLLA